MERPEVSNLGHEKTLETWYRQVRYEHALYNMAGDLCKKRYFFVNFLPTIIIAGVSTILATGISVDDFAYKDMTIALLSVMTGICAGTSHYWNWQGEAVRHATTAQAWSQMSEKLQRMVQEWREGKMQWCELHSTVLRCIGEIKRDSIEISGKTRGKYHHEIEEAARRYEIPRYSVGAKPKHEVIDFGTILPENGGTYVNHCKSNLACLTDGEVVEVLPNTPMNSSGALAVAPAATTGMHRPPAPSRHDPAPPETMPTTGHSTAGVHLVPAEDGRVHVNGEKVDSQNKVVSSTVNDYDDVLRELVESGHY
eukprot:TRINITY_DN3855_c0_g1_i3.p1 TRINITY_DN3855_c0_g1~~TRINITY_DN3855_c0_g1_i3.p1  ORF type:complete len:310 (+),score=37.72 TRINITY_DN3855_c0_g1_i3:125-1054(+)